MAIGFTLFPVQSTTAEDGLSADPLWRHGTAGLDCQIVAYDPQSQKLLTTVADGIEVLSIKSGKLLAKLSQPAGFHATSVAVFNGRAAVAWAPNDKRQSGHIRCYDVNNLEMIATFPAGYHPEMVTFSPDGRYLLAANEGEPSDDYSVDQEGSVTVIDTQAGISQATVRLADFHDFDAKRDELRTQGIRIFGPSQQHEDGLATVAEDLEPEYIAISPDSQRAWVTLQENNAIAEIDLSRAKVTAIHPLGSKDFSALADQNSPWQTTGLDASDRDGGWKIRNWPVSGLFQPDGAVAFEHSDETYLVTANEGDPRVYAEYQESCPVAQLQKRKIQLAPRHPARFLMDETKLGRLDVSVVGNCESGEGYLEQLHCFGTRSFSIWRMSPNGSPELVFDSGNDFERIVGREASDRFTSKSYLHGRCTAQGPEPESVVIGYLGSMRLAMISLERAGGIMVYDVSYPMQPKFLKYLPPLAEDGSRDCAPEGLVMIPAETSPTHKPLLVVCNEVSGTTTAYQLDWNYHRLASSQ